MDKKSNSGEEVAIALERLGIKTLNDLQNKSVQLHQTCNDIALLAQTGSGKTIAYLLPALYKLQRTNASLQTIIVVPARELALQVESVFRTLQTGFKIVCVYGGHDLRSERNSLKETPQIIVGTPGRLAYHARKGTIDGSNVAHIIFDEFDKVLEFGFLPDVEELYSYTPSVKNHTFTSATELGDLPDFLACSNVETADFRQTATPLQLEYFVVRSEGKDKLSALLMLLCNLQERVSVIFCNHRDAVDRIGDLLKENGVPHERFHGGMLQNQRELALAKFRNGSSRILLTTDLASRGLDIPEIDSVIHYQLPTTEASLTHRNGRTARMNAGGNIFYLLAEDDWMPTFIGDDVPDCQLSDSAVLPPMPPMVSLHINLGRKDKISKGDILGLLCKKGGAEKQQIGGIELKDKWALVAVDSKIASRLIKQLKDERLKNKKATIAKAR